MHLECFNMQDSKNFECKTKDLEAFQCKCEFFNTSDKKYKSISTYPNSSYFHKWLDDKACVAKRFFGDYVDRDNPNVRQLYSYCKEKDEELFLTCYSHTFKDLNEAFCGCVNNFGIFKYTSFKFDDRLVWADVSKKKIVSTSFSTSPTIHIVNTSMHSTQSIDMVKHTIMNTDLDSFRSEHVDMITPIFQRIFNTTKPSKNYDRISIVQNSTNNFNFSIDLLHNILIYLSLIVLSVIFVIFIFLTIKCCKKIKNKIKKQREISERLEIEYDI